MKVSQLPRPFFCLYTYNHYEALPSILRDAIGTQKLGGKTKRLKYSKHLSFQIHGSIKPMKSHVWNHILQFEPLIILPSIVVEPRSVTLPTSLLELLHPSIYRSVRRSWTRRSSILVLHLSHCKLGHRLTCRFHLFGQKLLIPKKLFHHLCSSIKSSSHLLLVLINFLQFCK